MIDAVNCEISSEYMDKSMSYFLLIPLHSQTGLSGFQGASVCCNGKSDNTVYSDLWREDSLCENYCQDKGNF